MEGECKTLQAHFGGKTVLHPPEAVLFDPTKPSCLTFGLLWFFLKHVNTSASP